MALKIISPWAISLAAMLWADFGHHYLFIILLGVLAVPVPFSLNMRTITGKWPPWGAVWRELLPKSTRKNNNVVFIDNVLFLRCPNCRTSPTPGWMQIPGHDGEPCNVCNRPKANRGSEQ